MESKVKCQDINPENNNQDANLETVIPEMEVSPVDFGLLKSKITAAAMAGIDSAFSKKIIEKEKCSIELAIEKFKEFSQQQSTFYNWIDDQPPQPNSVEKKMSEIKHNIFNTKNNIREMVILLTDIKKMKG